MSPPSSPSLASWVLVPSPNTDLLPGCLRVRTPISSTGKSTPTQRVRSGSMIPTSQLLYRLTAVHFLSPVMNKLHLVI